MYALPMGSTDCRIVSPLNELRMNLTSVVACWQERMGQTAHPCASEHRTDHHSGLLPVSRVVLFPVARQPVADQSLESVRRYERPRKHLHEPRLSYIANVSSINREL